MALFLASLVLAPAALAANGSAGKGYGGSGGNVQQQAGQGAAGAVSGGLPFTGLDLGLLVAGGAVMVVAGATLRRAAKRSS
ncbi:MAG: hypothetical protein WAQ33_09475 [Gaiellaceae bacterium]